MKENLIIYCILMSSTVLLISSCWPGPVYDPYIVPESRQKENLYYVPTAPNTHLLTEKNDLDFNLVYSAGSKFSGGQFQASYLPGKHVGVIGSYAGGVNDADHDYMKYNQFELGAGYVTRFPKLWHFETYAGMGTGKIDNSHATGISTIHLTNYFIQPAIVAENKMQTAQVAFVSKFSGVNFKVDTAFENDREPFSTNQARALYDKPFHVVWEPALVCRFGWKTFMFHVSYSYSADLTNSNLYRSRSNFSIGGGLHINTSKKD